MYALRLGQLEDRSAGKPLGSVLDVVGVVPGLLELELDVREDLPVHFKQPFTLLGLLESQNLECLECLGVSQSASRVPPGTLRVP